MSKYFVGFITVCVVVVLFDLRAMSSDPGAPKSLAGLWEARRNFGPEVRGTLTLTRSGGIWRVEISGRETIASAEKGNISFKLPGDVGSFQGRINRNEIHGHWIQPPLMHNGLRFASPVKLTEQGKDRWRGEVIPLEDEFTLYLSATPKDDGMLSTFLRNPDRNIGVFMNVDRLEQHGEKLKLIGKFLRNQEEITLAEGVYHEGEGRLSIYIRNRGGTYDFIRPEDDSASNFYARGKKPQPYRYEPPAPTNDGWQVGTLEEVGLSVEPIKNLIQNVIEAPVDSVHAPYVHGFLIARRGKLVLEEYFHGFHRDKPHDTRSASKSLTSVLIGAAIQKGAPLKASSSVYDVIYGKNHPPDIDPLKRKMTVEHLLTMSPGLDCDDSDPKSRGNEDKMQEQEENRDWYNYTLTLPMVSAPGKKTAYCSASPNLAGAVLSAATARSLPDLFDELIAQPLQIKRYHLDLQPTGEPYMGGGIYWMPRDFMKLGQLLLNDGVWNGQRILAKEWVRRSIAPLVEMGKKHYGYLWWLIDYPYQNRTVRAFFAGGNGGQVVMGIPELDLVLAFYAGNYSDPVLFKIQEEYVPQYILPAVNDNSPKP